MHVLWRKPFCPGSGYYNYFYPFRPPLGESRTEPMLPFRCVFFKVGMEECGKQETQELKAYIERQRRGPDLARLRCSAVADAAWSQRYPFKEILMSCHG